MKSKIILEVGILPLIEAMGGCSGCLRHDESLPMLDLADRARTRDFKLKFETRRTSTRASKSTRHDRVPPIRHSLDPGARAMSLYELIIAMASICLR